MDRLSFIFLLLVAMQRPALAWIPAIVQDIFVNKVSEPIENTPGDFTVLLGIPDSTAYIGNLFRLTIPENAFSGKVDEYKVNEAETVSLPSWLHFNASSNLLIGVPSSLDEGALVIEVTAWHKGGDQERLATTHFRLNVQKVNGEVLWNPGANPAITAVKFQSSPTNQKSNCEFDENVFHASLVLDATLQELSAEKRVKLVYMFANFISHSVIDIMLGVRQSEATTKLLNKHVVVAGPGNANAATSHQGVELSWFLGCGETFTQLEDFVQVIEHNINTGRISADVGFNVIGWQVIETHPPEPIRKLHRMKRQAKATPMPTQAILATLPKVSIPVTSVVENSRFSPGSNGFAIQPSQSGTPVDQTSSLESSTFSYLQKTSLSIEDSFQSTTFDFSNSAVYSSLQSSSTFGSSEKDMDLSSKGDLASGVSQQLHNTSEISLSASPTEIYSQTPLINSSEVLLTSPTPAVLEYAKDISTESSNSEADEQWSTQLLPNPDLQQDLSFAPSVYSSISNDEAIEILKSEVSLFLPITKDVNQTLIIEASATTNMDVDSSSVQFNDSFMTTSEVMILVKPSSSVQETASVLLNRYETNVAPKDTDTDSSSLPIAITIAEQPTPQLINKETMSTVLPMISSMGSSQISLDSSLTYYSDAVSSDLPVLTESDEISPTATDEISFSVGNKASMPIQIPMESSQIVPSEVDFSKFVDHTFSDAVTSSGLSTIIDLDGHSSTTSRIAQIEDAVSTVNGFSTIAPELPEISFSDSAHFSSSITKLPASVDISDTALLLPTELIVNIAQSILSSTPLFSESSSSSVVSDGSASMSATQEPDETSTPPVISTPTTKSDLAHVSSEDGFSTDEIFSSLSHPNITLMGPPRSTPVYTYSSSETISASSTQNITVVGPLKTTALVIDFESMRSLHESAIYASAGYESDDLVTSDISTTVHDISSSELEPSQTREVTPTLTSVLSEDATESATDAVAPQTSIIATDPETSHAISTGAPVDTPPFLLNPIDNISVSLGQYFEYKVPSDTFYDLQDGTTEKLKLILLDIDQSPLSEDSWIQFDEQKQVIFGIPLKTNEALTAQEFSLAAMDSTGSVSNRDAIVISVDKSAATNLNHFFYITFNMSYDSFIQETVNTIDLIFNIQNYFGENAFTSILVSDIQNGSVILKWSNSTLDKSKCDNDTMGEIFEKLGAVEEVNPDFQAAMSPKFPVTSVRLEYAGNCLPLLPVAPVPPIVGAPAATKSDSNVLYYTVIPAIIIALVIFVIAIILCYVRRKRRYTGKVLLDDERPIFNNDRKPVLLANELQMRDLSNVPKRPVVLNNDLDPNIDLDPDVERPSPGADGAIRPKPPPYYYPDDFDPMLDNLESPPPSYRGSPEGNTPPYGKRPPEYRLPPPYTAHVNPVFPNRGSSDA